MAQNLEELKKNYGDGVISRRDFIQQGATITGSLATAATLADSLRPNMTYAAQVDPNDPALNSISVTYTSADGQSIQAYPDPAEKGRHASRHRRHPREPRPQ